MLSFFRGRNGLLGYLVMRWDVWQLKRRYRKLMRHHHA